MKINHNPIAWLALLAIAIIPAATGTASAQGTAFTYQGRLFGAGSAANGAYDLRFGLYKPFRFR